MFQQEHVELCVLTEKGSVKFKGKLTPGLKKNCLIFMTAVESPENFHTGSLFQK